MSAPPKIDAPSRPAADPDRAASGGDRPAGWIRRHPKTVAFVCFIGLIGLTLFLLNWAAAVRLERLVQRLRDSGAPLTMVEVEAMRPKIPDSENMALRLMPAGDALMTWANAHRDMAVNVPILGMSAFEFGAPCGDEELAVLRQFCEQNREFLDDAIDAALTLQSGRYPFDADGAPTTILLPYCASQRALTRGLAVRANVEFQSGRRDEAARVARAMVRIDRAWMTEPTVIGGMVRLACDAVTLATIERALSLGEWDDAQLRDGQVELTPLDMHAYLDWLLCAERAFQFQMGREAYEGNLPNYVKHVSLTRRIPMLASLDRTESLVAYSRILEVALLPPLEAAAAADRIADAFQTGPAYFPFTRSTTFSLKRAIELCHRAVALRRAARTGLAAERFRLARGRWPAGQGELVPAFLDAVQLDPFDGQPLKMVLDERGLVIYSIGEDGTDEGGDVGAMHLPGDKQKRTDHGMRLLRVEQRGRARDGELHVPDDQDS